MPLPLPLELPCPEPVCCPALENIWPKAGHALASFWNALIVGLAVGVLVLGLAVGLAVGLTLGALVRTVGSQRGRQPTQQS